VASAGKVRLPPTPTGLESGVAQQPWGSAAHLPGCAASGKTLRVASPARRMPSRIARQLLEKLQLRGVRRD